MLKQVPHSPPEGYTTPVEFVVRRLCESHRCSRQRATVRKWDKKVSLSKFSTAFIHRSKNIRHYHFGKQLPSEASHQGDIVFSICVEFFVRSLCVLSSESWVAATAAFAAIGATFDALFSSLGRETPWSYACSEVFCYPPIEYFLYPPTSE